MSQRQLRLMVIKARIANSYRWYQKTIQFRHPELDGLQFSPLKLSPHSPKWMPLCRPTTSSIRETNGSLFWEDVVKCLASACAKRCGAPRSKGCASLFCGEGAQEARTTLTVAPGGAIPAAKVAPRSLKAFQRPGEPEPRTAGRPDTAGRSSRSRRACNFLRRR
jgi:hypothetical protein